MSLTTDSKVGILLVDDHTLFRKGLKLLLDESPQFEVVGEAGSAEEACQIAGELRPPIVLMDIALPGNSGLEGARLICSQHPPTKVIMISMHSKKEYIIQALQSGAVGFIVKDSTPDMLLTALETVSRGHYYFDHTAMDEIVQYVLDRSTGALSASESNYDKLTQREQEVMRFVAEGLTTKQIASHLCISPKTVENHRTKIMDKLHVDNIVDVVKYAAKLGIINIPT